MHREENKYIGQKKKKKAHIYGIPDMESKRAPVALDAIKSGIGLETILPPLHKPVSEPVDQEENANTHKKTPIPVKCTVRRGKRKCKSRKVRL